VLGKELGSHHSILTNKKLTKPEVNSSSQLFQRMEVTIRHREKGTYHWGSLHRSQCSSRKLCFLVVRRSMWSTPTDKTSRRIHQHERGFHLMDFTS
jgi:hypothetical protein